MNRRFFKNEPVGNKSEHGNANWNFHELLRRDTFLKRVGWMIRINLRAALPQCGQSGSDGEFDSVCVAGELVCIASRARANFNLCLRW